MRKAEILGSQTAKNGFLNEDDDIVIKFNNWKNDEDTRKWLLIMEYNRRYNFNI
jgi:hypothetical protein